MERWKDGEIEKRMRTNSDCPGEWVHYFSFQVLSESRVPGAWHPPFPGVLNTSHEYTLKRKKKREREKEKRR